MSAPHNYSLDQIRSILCEIIQALADPDNTIKLSEAKLAAGNEMLKMMQIIFPMVVKIEMDVIKNHGFASGREGIVQFTQIVREMERIDPEVTSLHNEIRCHFLPPVAITSQFDNSL